MIWIGCQLLLLLVGRASYKREEGMSLAGGREDQSAVVDLVFFGLGELNHNGIPATDSLSKSLLFILK